MFFIVFRFQVTSIVLQWNEGCFISHNLFHFLFSVLRCTKMHLQLCCSTDPSLFCCKNWKLHIQAKLSFFQMIIWLWPLLWKPAAKSFLNTFTIFKNLFCYECNKSCLFRSITYLKLERLETKDILNYRLDERQKSQN